MKLKTLRIMQTVNVKKLRPAKVPKPKQLTMLKAPNLAYGGILSRTRKGRLGPRPLSTKESIHLVLRSSKATGAWSFRNHKNKRAILAIVEKFAKKYLVQILSFANVGNHLHIHLRLLRREGYKPFIRAITGAIAMAVTGASRWKQIQMSKGKFRKRHSGPTELLEQKTYNGRSLKFWDYRPFTRVVRGFHAFLKLKDYVQINFWESQGLDRVEARRRLEWRLSTA